ncbi:hypothetical protein ACIXFW_20895, partial [Bacteroides fragilis]
LNNVFLSWEKLHRNKIATFCLILRAQKTSGHIRTGVSGISRSGNSLWAVQEKAPGLLKSNANHSLTYRCASPHDRG